MILGSIPFILYVQMLQGRFRPIFADQQVKAFFAFLVAAILAGWMMAHFGQHHLGLEGCRHAAFNVVSIVTGTGYSSTDYGLWGPHAVAFFFIIMFVGGCAGSTSCGIKIFRFQVFFEAVRQHIAQVMYPHGVFRARFNGKPIEGRVISSVMSFFFLFMASFMVLAILLRLSGLDAITSLSGAGTALANVGPGLGEIIGPAGNFQSLERVSRNGCSRPGCCWGGWSCSPFWCCCCHGSGAHKGRLPRDHDLHGARLCPLQTLPAAVDEGKRPGDIVADAHQCRHQKQHQQRGHGEAEDNGDRHGQQELGLQAFLVKQRQQPADGCQRRQKHGAQTVTARADSRFGDRITGSAAFLKPGHQDDGIIDQDARKP
jgi:hypothetical protein